jgi:hypothetical protein
MKATQLENVRTYCPIKKNETCILVGNGPSVNNSNLGKVIDSFDHVIRFNEFKIKGFEKHCGEKTTLWSTYGRNKLPSDEDVRPKDIIFIHGHTGDPPYMADNLWRIPLAFYWSLVPDHKKILPSSGFLVASWLFSQGVDCLHLIGFDHFSKCSGNKQHHYWLEKEFSTPKEHDSKNEAEVFFNWQKNGKVFYLK